MSKKPVYDVFNPQPEHEKRSPSGQVSLNEEERDLALVLQINGGYKSFSDFMRALLVAEVERHELTTKGVRPAFWRSRTIEEAVKLVQHEKAVNGKLDPKSNIAKAREFWNRKGPWRRGAFTDFADFLKLVAAEYKRIETEKKERNKPPVDFFADVRPDPSTPDWEAFRAEHEAIARRKKRIARE